MHELGHGLGFANFVSEDSGEGPLGLPDIYGAFSYDNTRAKYWNQMTNKERKASAVNTGNLVWHGPTVSGRAPSVFNRPTSTRTWDSCSRPATSSRC